MVLARKERSATYADYLAVPDGQRAELVDGEILMSPQPKIRHICVTTVLGGELSFRFGRAGGPTSSGPGGWWVFDEPECHLELDQLVFVPDIAGWRRERIPVLPSNTHKMTVVPDWICEVLSPSTSSRDSIVKMPCYLAAGVKWAWIIDPANQRLDVFRAGEGKWEPVLGLEGDATGALPPFDAVELDLAPWWADR